MSPYVTQYIFWSFTSGGAEMFMPDGMGDVYLRWFRLHSAGVSLSIPPVAPADVPAIPAQEFGHLPAVQKNRTIARPIYINITPITIPKMMM